MLDIIIFTLNSTFIHNYYSLLVQNIKQHIIYYKSLFYMCHAYNHTSYIQLIHSSGYENALLYCTVHIKIMDEIIIYTRPAVHPSFSPGIARDKSSL